MVEDSLATFYSEIDEALIWDNQVRIDVLAILEKWEPKILEWLDKYFASALMDGTVERCTRAEERLEAVKELVEKYMVDTTVETILETVTLGIGNKQTVWKELKEVLEG